MSSAHTNVNGKQNYDESVIQSIQFILHSNTFFKSIHILTSLNINTI